jgi:hypothetical protein
MMRTLRSSSGRLAGLPYSAHTNTGANVSKKRDAPQMCQLNEETKAKPELTFKEENWGAWLVPYQQMTARVQAWQPQPKDEALASGLALLALLPLLHMMYSLKVAAISSATHAYTTTQPLTTPAR